jgi:hypothetical protein
MIIMGMAQKDTLDGSEVFLQRKGVGYDGVAGSRVKKVVAMVRFNKSGETMFSKAHQFTDTVFTEYADFHGFLLRICILTSMVEKPVRYYLLHLHSLGKGNGIITESRVRIKQGGETEGPARGFLHTCLRPTGIVLYYGYDYR